MLVFLNRLVMKLVSFPMYVKVAHFDAGVCARVFVKSFLLVSGGGCGVGRWIGKALLCRMFWMVVTLHCSSLHVGCRCLVCYIGI